HKMIEVSDKRRHEIHHGKIRALYGHSVSQKFVKICSKPPDILYHGTLPEFAKTIKQEGLRPMGRQYAHLSVDRETAFQVGLRKGPTPVVLKIEAVNAYQAGTAFYEGNKNVWLADFVGPEHIYEGSHG
ncbi:MAG TPA: RNA 2'-phosphotransferase, partial [Alteromonas australica]|nr:RNA 2'-phosphotransferase [Alteromonas australica]